MTVTHKIYSRMLQRIVDGDIAPGSVLEERKLAEQMEVSRTPMRSALTQLLGEGLLERLSNGMLAVKAFSSAELLELLQIRIVLEGEAAASAAGRIPKEPLLELAHALEAVLCDRARQEEWNLDESLHQLIADHCGNKTLRNMLLSIKRQSALCRVERMSTRLTAAREEHLKILRALLASDPAAARAAMTEHLRQVQQSYINSLTGVRAPLER